MTAHSVRYIAQLHGLDLIHVDHLKTHGGSNRYWLSRSGEADTSVTETLDDELNIGLHSPSAWETFRLNSEKSIDALRTWLDQKKQNGDVIAAYGAAHKGNTFLNAVGMSARHISYVVDASSEKQGKFLPGAQIPVISPDRLNEGYPSDVLILPWNISTELVPLIKDLAPQARIWVAQPTLKELTLSSI